MIQKTDLTNFLKKTFLFPHPTPQEGGGGWVEGEGGGGEEEGKDVDMAGRTDGGTNEQGKIGLLSQLTMKG